MRGSGTSSRRVRSSRLGEMTAAPKVATPKPRGSPRGLRGRAASAAAAAAGHHHHPYHHHQQQQQRSGSGGGSSSGGTWPAADPPARREDWGDERFGDDDDGRRPMKPFEGSEGLLLLSMIAEAQETAKSRKRVKLPDMPARRCGYCGARSTVQWRSGPKEIPILCNACGVKYRKGKLHLKNMTADRTVKSENLENAATLDRLHLGDQGVGSSVAGSRNSHAMSMDFESDIRDSKCKNAKLNCTRMPPPRRPLGDGLPPEALPLPGFPRNPSVWDFIPPLVVQNQAGSVGVRPGFNNVYPCAGGFMPVLPVRPLLSTGDEGPRKWWPLQHPNWPKWDVQLNRLGDFDASFSGRELEEAEDEMVIEDEGKDCTDDVDPKEAHKHLTASKEYVQINDMPTNSEEETLRWLVKRKRTGPKITG